ncbi:MAG: universal stress protein [Cyclobacteriaceae bacterium]|nr:universal stress protein [Cyclobacteriaceae bacterium]
MKKILVPTDFSKDSITALEAAVDVAKRMNYEIVLLHVVEEAMADSFSISGQGHPVDFEERRFTVELLKRARKQLEKLVLDPKYSNVKITGELRMGNPFHGMTTIIASHKVELVVMGTRGHTKIEEMVIGTNTEKVIRHSHCPILTINKKPATMDFKNIVYATNMSKDEEVFSRIVKKAQHEYNATVHLLRVNTPGDFQRDRVVKEALEKFAKKLQLKNYTINVYNDISTEEGIIYFADTIGADLIAMATHGRTGFAHVLAGSVAEGVAGHSKRPVLTFVVKH